MVILHFIAVFALRFELILVFSLAMSSFATQADFFIAVVDALTTKDGLSNIT